MKGIAELIFILLAFIHINDGFSDHFFFKPNSKSTLHSYRLSDSKDGWSMKAQSSNPRYSKENKNVGNMHSKIGKNGNNLEDTLRKTWRTGTTMINTQIQKKPTARRNDPWWMRDEEKNNPRMLPIYRPWWDLGKLASDQRKTIKELQTIAKALGLGISGSKKELTDRIKNHENLYSMDDSNFRSPTYIPWSASNELTRESCYPDVYEVPVHT